VKKVKLFQLDREEVKPPQEGLEASLPLRLYFLINKNSASVKDNEKPI